MTKGPLLFFLYSQRAVTRGIILGWPTISYACTATCPPTWPVWAAPARAYLWATMRVSCQPCPCLPALTLCASRVHLKSSIRSRTRCLLKAPCRAIWLAAGCLCQCPRLFSGGIIMRMWNRMIPLPRPLVMILPTCLLHGAGLLLPMLLFPQFRHQRNPLSQRWWKRKISELLVCLLLSWQCPKNLTRDLDLCTCPHLTFLSTSPPRCTNLQLNDPDWKMGADIPVVFLPRIGVPASVVPLLVLVVCCSELLPPKCHLLV